MALKLIAVFFASTAVGILYRIPRNLLLYGSFTGALAWMVFFGTVERGGDIILASFLGSVAVGITAEAFARLLRKPATIFIVPGFIPLVPGRNAYAAMRYLVEGKYTDGVSTVIQTMLVAGAIAFGIFISSTTYRLISNNRLGSSKSDIEKS